MSPVQTYGLEILMMLEARDKARSAIDKIKHALVSFDPVKFLPDLFPHIAKPVDMEDEEDPYGTEGNEPSDIEFADSEIKGPQDVEKVLQELMASSVSITPEDTEGGWV